MSLNCDVVQISHFCYWEKLKVTFQSVVKLATIYHLRNCYGFCELVQIHILSYSKRQINVDDKVK